MQYSDYEILEFIREFAKNRPAFYESALCRGMGIGDFFPGRGKSASIKRAQSLCKYCPVMYECHQYAMENGIEDGVWGGSTPEQRSAWIQQNISVEESWLRLDLE